MMNLHDTTSHDPENQGMLPGEQSIQPDSAELMDILAAFLDCPPDALIVVDSTGMMALVNTQAATLFGYDHDELIGQPVELLLSEHLRVAHAAQRTHYMQAARSRPMGVGLDLVGQRKDGSQFPVDISLRPIRIKHTLHVIAAIRDMTAQREVERERMQIFQRLRQQDKLLSLSRDAILIHDPESHIVFWNEGAEYLYGWTAQEVMGKVTHMLLQTRFPISQEALDRSLEQHDQWQGELTHTCRAGRQVIVESRQVLMRDEQSRPSAILEINRDVTTLKEAEALKDQFISLATHELRSPVTIITGYADRLLSRAAQGKGHELDEWQREIVQEMKQASWQLANLTEDLLDVTRIQAGQFALERRSTNLVELTQKVIKRLQATTDQHQIAFRSTAAQLWAMVDVCRIEQVLSNLLSNAIKYSPGGGPIEVTLEEHTEPHAARFRLRDQGMGIPRAQQAHLFGRFVRGENVRVAGIRGTGLGLYLCRELVERHGGHISFESEEGVGSTFFFSLPCTEAVQPEKGNALHERTDSASPSS